MPAPLLTDFLKENEIRIGKDFQTTPPVYYHSLNDAYYNYFQTLRDYKETYHFLLDFQSWDRESLAANYGNSKSTVFAILGFHRFFELLLKDILKRFNPFLAVKFLEKDEDLIKFFDNNLSPEDVNSVEFTEANKRIRRLFTYYSNKPEEINIITKFEFLNSPFNQETLSELAKWRNRIIHNGNTVPNIYALDYLVSQRITSLVIEIIDADKETLNQYTPHYFETFTGIKIIDRIRQIKFDYMDFTNPNKSSNLGLAILELAHLKELGRAMYKTDPAFKRNRSFYESYYKDPIQKFERFAAVETAHLNFHSLKNCPCCGFNTLIIYKDEYQNAFTKEFKMEFISWFKCFACDYSLKNNLGDPYYFEISKEKIFPEE